MILQRTMGKNKGNHKGKNVFKVAKVRSMKLKTKAQKVVTNLKKVSDKYLENCLSRLIVTGYILSFS